MQFSKKGIILLKDRNKRKQEGIWGEMNENQKKYCIVYDNSNYISIFSANCVCRTGAESQHHTIELGIVWEQRSIGSLSECRSKHS